MTNWACCHCILSRRKCWFMDS